MTATPVTLNHVVEQLTAVAARYRSDIASCVFYFFANIKSQTHPLSGIAQSA